LTETLVPNAKLRTMETIRAGRVVESRGMTAQERERFLPPALRNTKTEEEPMEFKREKLRRATPAEMAERVERVRKLRDEGLVAKEISERLGLSKGDVIRALAILKKTAPRNASTKGAAVSVRSSPKQPPAVIVEKPAAGGNGRARIGLRVISFDLEADDATIKGIVANLGTALQEMFAEQ
jgi:hypothetical protein